jgi:uncharacterized membrane protein YdjX (TVP38/TMEM64 family)
MGDLALQLFETFVKPFSDSVLGPVAYVMLITAEVIVAPVPGIMLYAPGGLMFGPWLGGALAIIGNTLGAGISCVLARTIGQRWLQTMAVSESVQTLQTTLQQRGFWLILLMRLNPLTSTDLLSYAAGLTRIPVLHVMLATGLGMTPLCLVQSWLSDSIFHRWPSLLWPLMVAGGCYVIVVVWILVRMLRTAKQSVPESHSA